MHGIHIAFVLQKDPPDRYKGAVVKQWDECNCSTGFPYIIRYTNSQGQPDSFMTATLPEQYKIPNKKISFDIREPDSSDEPILCLQLFVSPHAKVIFNVTER